MAKKFLSVLLLALCFHTGFSQDKPLTIQDLVDFQILKSTVISHQGNWIAYYSEPFRGDSWLFVTDSKSRFAKKYVRGVSPVISPDENYIAFTVKPGYDTLKQLKLEKVDKKKFPKDSAYVFVTSSREVLKFPRLNKFIIPSENGSFLGVLQYLPDSVKQDKKANLKVYNLLVMNPGQQEQSFPNVSEAVFSANGEVLAFNVYKKDSLGQSSTVCAFYPRSGKVDTLYSVDGIIKKLTIDEQGQKLAFIQSTDTVKTKVYSLYYMDLADKKVHLTVDTNTESIPNDWTVSENGKIFFSKDGKHLYFGIAHKPVPEPKDTVPEDEKPVVDIWSWTDSVLMPVQLKNRDKDLKKSYLTVYNFDSGKIMRLEQNKYERVRLYNHGNASKALVIDPSHYLKERSWDYPWYNDYYVIDLSTGKRTLAVRKAAIAYMSPSGNYVVWYNHGDSSWYGFILRQNKTVRLTNNKNVNFWDEDNDVPAPADPYGFGGFSADEKHVYLYDRYDVWAFDPSGTLPGFNLTASYGRQNNIVFRLVDLNTEDAYISPGETILSAFDKTDKSAGFFKLVAFDKASRPQKLIFTPHYYYTPQKAKNADVILWRRSDVDDYPDVWISNMDFAHAKRLSHLVDQQDGKVWATVELVKWTTTDGKTAEGLLYKPSNFDPSKKYPVIVYYYELYSDMLHRYFYPKPSRSIINPVHYASNGYIVFIPNIRYKVGFPGMSAYNYVISGVLSLVDKYPWIDKDHMGLQGQSWGGYETAYIITQTDMFAAAMAGAPVSNMTSAYGGIRWGSGYSRMFQYEKTQSRIGGTLWDKTPLYIYNSPLFYAPKINTPLLIMHNDKDGAVPWYQGIELFVALRRLNKPVWMLTYNGQPHNLQATTPDCVDLTIRMMQFFDYYLKQAPEPYWMKYGIPAVQKGRNLGYQTEK